MKGVDIVLLQSTHVECLSVEECPTSRQGRIKRFLGGGGNNA